MSEELPLIMFGLPKGSLEEATIRLFAKAGWNIRKSSRSYKPSIDDEEVTERLAEAGEILGIRLLDHVVFSLHGYLSFVQSGRM